MSLGDSWGLNASSPSKLNKMTVISGTGAYLAGLSLSEHTLLRCTATGSGFTIDHIYLTEADGSGKIDLSVALPHTHYNSTDGGNFGDVLISASPIVDTGSTMTTDIDINYWSEGTSGTGSTAEITDHASYDKQKVLKALTGATSGSTASRRLSGLMPDYDADGLGNSQMQCIAQVSHTTSISARWGYGMESLSAVDDNDRKYGFNICTSVNGNWFARSADGDSRSDSDIGVAFTTAVTNLTASYDEDNDSIDYYVDFDDLLNKTADIPISSNGSGENLFRFGVKNSTAADRNAYLLKLRLNYYTSDNWW